MWQTTVNVRFLLPVVVSGLLSFALCAVMAVFLFRAQATSAAALEETILSHRAAADLQENLADLVAVLKDRAERVPTLNARIAQHLQAIRRLADHPEEVELVDRVIASFQRYRDVWSEVSGWPEPKHEGQVQTAIQVLEGETLKACQELREYNARRIDAANDGHRAMLRRLAWGLAGIGGSAGLAGVFLGYGVARGLTRSIQRIQVHVQDAAGKLGRDLPAVELSGGNLAQLDRQVIDLIGRIEEVVDQLQQREREVLRAEQLAAVGQMAAGMAHEIRNPLTSIKMLVQAAREQDGHGLPADDLAVIEREVRRVERSLQTFLDYARPPRPAKAPTDLSDLIRETLELTRGRAAKQQVTVDFAPPDLVRRVHADPGQLRQVLVNLVMNSLDAMPGGGVLTIKIRESGADSVEVVVRDTGPGISPEIRGRLFQPFASTKETGLGLGLVICRRILEEHGGSVTADDAPGGGAQVTIRLPKYVGRAAVPG